MARIAYFYREMSEYIQIEIDLLSERHEVTIVECASRWPHPIRLLRVIPRADVVVAWFASWHSFTPALLCRLSGRPFVVTVGGYDTANLPEVQYGHQRGGVRRWIALAAMRLATRVIVVSEASRREVRALGLPPGKLDLVFHGLDPERYPESGVAREDMAVTVCGVNRSNLRRKGLEAFVGAAAHCPRTTFVIIGAWMDDAIDRLRAIAPPNVHFTGRIPHAEKIRWLSRSRVLVQASLHEAFGLSVAEGMLCGAVPVVTRVGALPEVVGDCGVLIDSPDVETLAAGVRRGLALGPEAGARARSRVREQFPTARKRAGIEAVISAVLGGNPPPPAPGA